MNMVSFSNGLTVPEDEARCLRFSMGLIFNGVSIPDPSSYTYGFQDGSSEDAGRDETFTMHTMKIKDEYGNLINKRTHKFEWKNIGPYTTAYILTAVSTLENFECTMFDPMTNAARSATYYVGDRTAPIQQWFEGDEFDGKLYQKLAFDLIEV